MKIAKNRRNLKRYINRQRALDEFKTTLSSAPIPRYTGLNRSSFLTRMQTIMESGMSTKEQTRKGFDWVLNKPKRNYCVTRRKLLAAAKAAKDLHEHP